MQYRLITKENQNDENYDTGGPEPYIRPSLPDTATAITVDVPEFSSSSLPCLVEDVSKKVLVRKRREVIPADPKEMSDIDLDLPIFLYKYGENVIKGVLLLKDGRRILLFLTNEHLRILPRD